RATYVFTYVADRFFHLRDDRINQLSDAWIIAQLIKLRLGGRTSIDDKCLQVASKRPEAIASARHGRRPFVPCRQGRLSRTDPQVGLELPPLRQRQAYGSGGRPRGPRRSWYRPARATNLRRRH